MDPLSLTASIIAVLGAGGTIVNTLKKANLIRQAPEIILTLNNEISDLRLIVHETERLLRENQARDPIASETRTFADEVTPVLIRGRDKLLELETLIEYNLTAPHTNSNKRLKVRKIAWVRHQQKLQTIKKDIRSLRTNLAAIVGLAASKATSRLELRISQIQTDSNALHSRLDSALPDIIGVQARSADLLDNLFRSFTASQETPVVDSSSTVSAEQPRPVAQANMLPCLQIHLARQFDSCPLGCSCACHCRSTWRSPQCLQFFLGLLFTGYTGVPILNPRCDVDECVQSSQSSIYFKYFFPPWLLACVVEYYVRISRSYGISQCLRMSNVISNGAPIFLLALNGEINGLKKLLSSRKGSPFDVSLLNGGTALLKAISRRHVGTAQLLLDAGSDPHAQDACHVLVTPAFCACISINCIDNPIRSPYRSAWNHIMRTGRSDPVAEAFRSMFPDPDLESYRFTPIHKAVLNMPPVRVSLNQVVGLCSKEMVNMPDITGKTPLMWAVYRGDHAALRLLLLNGADPSKTTYGGTTLYWAARGGSYDCVDLLLRHGADPNIHTQQGEVPIHGLSYANTDDVMILNLLIVANANINEKTTKGSTPLTWAIHHQQQQIAIKLIHLGADIHHCKPDGTNGLYMATYFNLHRIIVLLLERGSDHMGAVQIPHGPYLHLIAHRADTRTLKLLTNALSPRDIYYKRQDGATALDVARDRSDVDSDWRDAFNTFIGSVYKSTMVTAVEEVSTMDEVFTDALEQQP